MHDVSLAFLSLLSSLGRSLVFLILYVRAGMRHSTT